MKTKKTRSDARGTYTYTYYEEGANGKYDVKKTVTLRPGENGVTEADIKGLHALDDSEVYNNNKNIKQCRTKAEEAEIEQWKKEYIARMTLERGTEPSKDEVEGAVEVRFPKMYHASIDYDYSNGGMDEDKSNVSAEISIPFEEENPIVDRMHEVMEGLTEKQREVLILTEFEGYTFTEVAKMRGISVNSVKKHHDKAIKFIEENFYK